MRGRLETQVSFSTITPEMVVPSDHPIRRIKPIVDAALKAMDETLAEMYAGTGRPSIPPENLIRGCVLMALYSIRSERQLCERIAYDLLFKWFLDMNVDDGAWDPSTFAKNRTRLLEHAVSREFFKAVLTEARKAKLLSAEHFTVDGTLLEARASLKSFQPKPNLGGQRKKQKPGKGGKAKASKGRNPEVNWHGEKRSNQTHASTTDPEAQLARKGNNQPAKMSYAGHVLMENRNGLIVDRMLTQATGTAEREAAKTMLRRTSKESKSRRTVGCDKGYDTKNFVKECREMGVTPHVTQNESGKRKSNIDGRTTRHSGYQVSQRVRKRVEEIFGWVKTVGNSRKLRYTGVERNHLWWDLALTTFNIVRMANLGVVPA